MSKWAIALVFFVFLLPMSVSQESVYTGEVNESGKTYEVDDDTLKSIKPVFEGDVLDLNVSRQESQIDGLDIFTSYSVNSSKGNLTYLGINLSKEKFGTWKNDTGHESFEYIILNDNRRVNFLDETDDGYIGEVYHTESDFSFSVVGSFHIYHNYTQAINPSETVCTLYWKPNSSFQNVSACNQTLINQNNSNELENSTDSSFISEELKNYIFNGLQLLLLILFIFGLALLIPGLITKLRDTKGGSVQEVDRKSNEIIEKIRSGRIPKNEDNLEKLNRANQEAYNDNYEKALSLLDSIDKTPNFDEDSSNSF